jgi:hypothetical protein
VRYNIGGGPGCPSWCAQAAARVYRGPWAILTASPLKPAWAEGAGKQGVSETIAAAVYLLAENRKAEEVAGKLSPSELGRVIDIIGHQQDRFPPGTLAALRESRPTPPKASPPSDSPSAGPTRPRRDPATGRMRRAHFRGQGPEHHLAPSQRHHAGEISLRVFLGDDIQHLCAGLRRKPRKPWPVFRSRGSKPRAFEPSRGHCSRSKGGDNVLRLDRYAKQWAHNTELARKSKTLAHLSKDWALEPPI